MSKRIIAALAGAAVVAGLIATGGSDADRAMVGSPTVTTASEVCAMLADGVPFLQVGRTLGDDPTVTGKQVATIQQSECPTVAINWEA